VILLFYNFLIVLLGLFAKLFWILVGSVDNFICFVIDLFMNFICMISKNKLLIITLVKPKLPTLPTLNSTLYQIIIFILLWIISIGIYKHYFYDKIFDKNRRKFRQKKIINQKNVDNWNI